MKILFQVKILYRGVPILSNLVDVLTSDRMKTLIRFFKDYDKIMFMDCQIHFLNIYLRRKEILLFFFHHFVELLAKNQPLLDYF